MDLWGPLQAIYDYFTPTTNLDEHFIYSSRFKYLHRSHHFAIVHAQRRQVSPLLYHMWSLLAAIGH